MHGATGDFPSGGIDAAVFYGECAFGELGAHTQQTRNDHPEGGTRATDTNGHRHARDVTDANRARDRCGQRLKLRHLAGCVGLVNLAPQDLDRMVETGEINAAQKAGEKQSTHNQPDNN